MWDNLTIHRSRRKLMMDDNSMETDWCHLNFIHLNFLIFTSNFSLELLHSSTFYEMMILIDINGCHRISLKFMSSIPLIGFFLAVEGIPLFKISKQFYMKCFVTFKQYRWSWESWKGTRVLDMMRSQLSSFSKEYSHPCLQGGHFLLTNVSLSLRN